MGRQVRGWGRTGQPRGAEETKDQRADRENQRAVGGFRVSQGYRPMIKSHPKGTHHKSSGSFLASVAIFTLDGDVKFTESEVGFNGEISNRGIPSVAPCGGPWLQSRTYVPGHLAPHALHGPRAAQLQGLPGDQQDTRDKCGESVGDRVVAGQ